ncbi:MAG: hypothetical protein IE916_07685 [Epsilonproteobacteria bacterium]|nr:hypothetical protein [Campylobacterota bacterium]
MKKPLLLLASAAALLAQIDFMGHTLMVRHSNEFNNGTYLWDTPDGKKATFTYENFTAFSELPLGIGGDIYSFVDYVKTTAKKEHYFEIQPRISLNKTSGSDFGFLFIKDYTLNYQLNQSEGYKAYLYGGGLDFDIPSFEYFNIALLKKEQNFGKNTHQISSAYHSNFYGNFHFMGFVDYTPQDILTQNQLYYAYEKFLNLGVNWNYYKDIDNDIESSVPQVMIKLTF